MKHFMILGNGGGGTSLLRGLINAHSKCQVLFEHKGHRPDDNARKYLGPDMELERWLELSKITENGGYLWGNKVPIEQFKTRGYNTQQVVRLIDYFKIVFIRRRWSRYYKKGRAREETYLEFWDWWSEVYRAMREKRPDMVIRLSFEDLLLRTEMELKRICDFLEIDYEPEMLKGTMDTGLASYNQEGIDMSRL